MYCRLVNLTVIRDLVQRTISNLVAEIKGQYEKGTYSLYRLYQHFLSTKDVNTLITFINSLDSKVDMCMLVRLHFQLT